MTSSSPKRALITGASSGIGRATALAFARAGIELALVSRNQGRLDTVAEQARQTASRVETYPVDLADLAQIQPKLNQVLAQFGPINILVNNAGMGYTNLLTDTSLEDWQQVLDLNLTSVFQCMQAVLPALRQTGQGTIINVASIAAYNAFPQWGAYSVSKAALVALSKTLAVEERSHGIRVSIITPGAVNTSIWDTETVDADFDRDKMLTPETIAQAILQVALLPLEAVVEEVTLMPSAGAL